MKTRHIILSAIIAMTFAACNSKVENDHDGDSITVDTVVPIDSVIIDTTDTLEFDTDTL